MKKKPFPPGSRNHQAAIPNKHFLDGPIKSDRNEILSNPDQITLDQKISTRALNVILSLKMNN